MIGLDGLASDVLYHHNNDPDKQHQVEDHYEEYWNKKCTPKGTRMRKKTPVERALQQDKIGTGKVASLS